MFRSFLIVGAFASLTACNREAPPPAESPTPAGPSAPEPTPTGSAAAPAPAPSGEASLLSSEECQARAGEVIADIGDGKTREQGCPDGRALLGSVRIGIESGICCAAAPAAPRPAGKRAPCTLGQDQTCNGDPSVSALWGKCLPGGTCECKPGFELAPTGYCYPVKK